MSEDGAGKLDYTKTEGDVRTSEYRKGLENAIELYSITDKAFKNPKNDVINGAVRLLSGYDIESSFIHNEERDLFALAISDAWLSTDSIKEKRALLDILKLVATGEREEDRNLKTLSGKVKILSEAGFERGTMFDPEATSGNSHSEYVGLVLKYVEDNTDPKLTEEVSQTLTDWDENSKMSHVRNKLGVTSKDGEKPFKVAVLNKTAQQMYDDVGYTSLYITRGNETTAVFNGDYKNADSLEHEYAHSQSEGMSRFYQNLLFRGVNEALTERSTSEPNTYPLQRKFLAKILEIHPDYESLLYQTYAGSETSRIKIFSKMLNDYGLQGFLTFARIAPIDNPKMSGGIGESIYIAPHKALDSLGVMNKDTKLTDFIKRFQS